MPNLFDLPFEAMQHRIKHAFRPLEFALRKLSDFPDNLVSVAFAVREDGKNQRPGGGGDKVFLDVHSSPMPTSDSEYIVLLYIALLCISRFPVSAADGGTGNPR